MQTHDKLFIGGEWVAPSTSSAIEVVSPHTEEVIARVAAAREADVGRAVAAARAAFDDGPWPRLSGAERADVMARLGDALKNRAGEMAATITAEMGSPISFSHVGQVMAANMVLDYFTGLAREYPFEETRPGMLGPALVRREPVGVCGLIVPWNVPQFVTMLKLAPCLAAGSTAVLKPAPETPLDAILLADAVDRGGCSEGRDQHRSGRTRGRRAPGDARRRRQDQLHRQHRRRPPHRLAVRRAAQARHPGAGRQVGRDHPRRRRPRRQWCRACCPAR